MATSVKIVTKKALARVYSKSSLVDVLARGGVPRDNLLANSIAHVEISR